MKKFFWSVIFCLMAVVTTNAQEFASSKDRYINVAKATTFGKHYVKTSLGEAIVKYNNEKKSYSLTFGTSNRFDNPMYFDFETKEELIETLKTLLGIIESKDKGDFRFPDGSITYVYYYYDILMPVLWVSQKGYAGDGYLPKRALNKLIKEIELFDETNICEKEEKHRGGALKSLY